MVGILNNQTKYLPQEHQFTQGLHTVVNRNLSPSITFFIYQLALKDLQASRTIAIYQHYQLDGKLQELVLIIAICNWK